MAPEKARKLSACAVALALVAVGCQSRASVDVMGSAPALTLLPTVTVHHDPT